MRTWEIQTLRNQLITVLPLGMDRFTTLVPAMLSLFVSSFLDFVVTLKLSYQFVNQATGTVADISHNGDRVRPAPLYSLPNTNTHTNAR